MGSDLTYWILTKSGKVISCSTVQHITDSEQQKPDNKLKIEDFNRPVRSRLANTNFIDDAVQHLPPHIQDIELRDDKEVQKGIIPTNEEYGEMIEEDLLDVDEHDNHDKLIEAELRIEIGGKPLSRRVIKCNKGPDGTRKGIRLIKTLCLTGVNI